MAVSHGGCFTGNPLQQCFLLAYLTWISLQRKRSLCSIVMWRAERWHCTSPSAASTAHRDVLNLTELNITLVLLMPLISALFFLLYLSPTLPTPPALSPLWLRGYTISTYWCGCEHDWSRVMVLCLRAGSPWDLSGYLLFGVFLFCFVFIFFLAYFAFPIYCIMSVIE